MQLTPQAILKDPILQQNFLDSLSKTDLEVFSQHVLGYVNGQHHAEWYGILQNKYYTDSLADWDSALIEAPEGHVNHFIALLAPRSHSKSTSFTVNYPLWKIGNDPNIRILIVSASSTISESFLREIKGHMMNNVSYRRVFGDLYPDDVLNAEKWSNTEIIVKRPNTRLKDPTVAVTSAGGSVVSRRADIIICDDILDEKNTKTAEQRAKLKEWFEVVLMPVLEPDGTLIVVGTAWSTEDLYHKLMKKRGYDVRKRYKAILNQEQRLVLWPERWSFDDLMKRKQDVGSVSFNKSYQNEALSPEDAIFQVQWLEQAKQAGKSRKLLKHFDYAQWTLGQVTIGSGVDLAISKKKDSDFTAIAVVARLDDGRKIPLWLERGKYSPAETRARIKSLRERYNPDIIIVENNAYQEALRRDLADETDLPIRGYTTGGEKFDETVGINSLAVEFENGKWILPYSDDDPYTQEMVDILVAGMLDFPSGHTEDLLMALWFANNGLRDLTATVGEIEQVDASSIFGR